MAKDTVVPIRGDQKHLEQTIKKAKANMRAFASTVRSGANSFTKYAGIATGAMAATTAAIYKSRSAQIDALAKTADALNINIVKLQALNQLAELNGVSSEQMAKGLQRMERGLGEAARKGGTTADALEDAGVSIQSIISLKPDQQIQQLANAIGNVQNQSIKASIASDLFGRDGVKMLKVLTQLQKDGLDPTAKKLESMGAAINRIDAAQVEAANDAFLEAQKVIGGAADILTVKLAPYVRELSERFTEAAIKSGGFGKQIETAFKTGVRGGAKLTDVFQGLKVAFKGTELILAGFKGAAVSVFQIIAEGWVKQASVIVGGTNKIISALNRLGAGIEELPDPSDSKFMQGLRELGDSSRNDVSRIREELHNLSMQEMPSKKVEEFLNAVTEKSKLAAAEVAKVVGGTEDGEDSGGVTESDDKTKKALEKLQQRFKLEQERLAIKLEEDRATLRASLEQKLLDETEFKELEKQLNQSHQDAITGIERDAASERAAIAEAEAQRRYDAMHGALTDLTTLMNSESRKMFEIGKAAAISQTVIDTYQAAQSSYKALSGIPVIGPALGAAAAAAAVASGMQRVSAIRSQSFGGGAGAQATGSNTAAVNAASAPTGGGDAPQRHHIEGISEDSMHSGGQVRELFKGINQGLSDGMEFVLA